MADILVLGARGMLGRAMISVLGERCLGLGKDQCDITNAHALARCLAKLRPASVITCAGYTRVDDAEKEREIALLINGEGPGIVARAAQSTGSAVYHISTDYIFDGSGQRPWKEDDPPNPVNFYGHSKLEGERKLKEAGAPWCIIRTQWLFGPGGRNFVDTISRLCRQKDEIHVVADQVGAPTLTMDLARAIAVMVARGARGVFHLANSGYASWYEVATHVVARINGQCRVIPCTSEQYPRPAPRPRNSRLDCTRAQKELGIALRPWKEAVDDYLATAQEVGPCRN